MKAYKHKQLKHFFLGLVLVISTLCLLTLPAAGAYAQIPPPDSVAAAITQAGVNAGSLPTTAADNNAVTRVLDIVFSIAGSISLLMIIIGGFRYITAGSDPGAVSRAKGTIIYAVVGLLVTLAAYSIVTLVVNGVA